MPNNDRRLIEDLIPIREISAEASLGLCIVLTLFFALPQTLTRTMMQGRRRRQRGRDDGA